MNSASVLSFLWLALIVVAYWALISRSSLVTGARLAVTLSGSTLLVAALLGWLKSFSEYTRWFLPPVYPLLEWGAVGLTVVGSAALVFALARYLKAGSGRDSDLEISLHDLSASPATSHRSSADVSMASAVVTVKELRELLCQPFPFVEISRLALDRLLSFMSIKAGAIYVFNESSSEMVLISSIGLSPEEESSLERMNLTSPALIEAFATGGVTVSGKLDLGVFGANDDRKSAVVVAPFLDGSTPLGCALLLTEEAPRFSAQRRMVFDSLSGVISDRYLLVKLRGDLSRERRSALGREESARSWSDRWQKAISAVAYPADYDALSVALLGVGGVDQVALLTAEAEEDGLTVIGSSGDFALPGAGFSKALSQALFRGEPVLLNQERHLPGGGHDEKSARRVPVALVVPLLVEHSAGARGILFWNSTAALTLDRDELKWLQDLLNTVSSILALGERALKSGQQARAVAQARKLMTEVAGSTTSHEALDRFMNVVDESTPAGAKCLLLNNDGRAGLRLLTSRGLDKESDRERVQRLLILPGEGSIGRSATLAVESLECGQERMRELSLQYDTLNRDVFGDGFSGLGDVAAQLIVPLVLAGNCQYALVVFLEDEVEAPQILRRLSELVSLQSVLLSVFHKGASAVPESLPLTEEFSHAVNRVNNELLIISGNCQTLAQDPNLSGDIERTLGIVLQSAERASADLRLSASLLQEKVSEFAKSQESAGSVSGADVSLSDVSVSDVSVSGVSLAGIALTFSQPEGKQWQVSSSLEDSFEVELTESEARELIVAMGAELDPGQASAVQLRVSSYRDGPYHYLDFTCQGGGFPPAERVGALASFSPVNGRLNGVSEGLVLRLGELGFEMAAEMASQADSDSTGACYVSVRRPHAVVTESENLSELSKPTGPRIMAVDDQTMILELIQAMCDSAGYSVEVFSSSEQAAQAFASSPFDIVISDIAMPGLDGWEVARRIREIRPDTHIIFITGWGENISESKLADNGIAQILYKPFRLEQLVEALDKACKSLLTV